MSSFLGLTLLGPQSPFSSEYKHAVTLGIFTTSDFKGAFSHVAGGQDKTIDASQLPAIMRHIFRGPAPEVELSRVVSAFSSSAAAIDLSSFLTKMQCLVEEEDASASPEKDRSKAATFNSLDLMNDQRRRQRRSEEGPKELFSHPLTLTQEIGWLAHEAQAEKRHPKKSCAETRFMAKLRSSGYI